jgi:hypothetical protein
MISAAVRWLALIVAILIVALVVWPR